MQIFELHFLKINRIWIFTRLPNDFFTIIHFQTLARKFKFLKFKAKIPQTDDIFPSEQNWRIFEFLVSEPPQNSQKVQNFDIFLIVVVFLGTLEEYLNLRDKESAFEDICGNFHPNHMSKVAEEMILAVIEGKPDKMKLTGELLDFLVIKHALLPTQLQNAFNTVLEFSEDLIYDVPKLWDNIAMVLGM